jgi:hypothetical protein
MLISTVQRGQRWPLPDTHDADLRTRLLAALHTLEQTIAVGRSLQTTIIWSMWMVQDPDATETEQLAALDRLAKYLARRWKVRGERVRAELQRTKEEGYVLRAPKTKQSQRRIILGAVATAALRAHRARQAAERLAMGEAWDASLDLVFPNTPGPAAGWDEPAARSFLSAAAAE